MQPDGTAAAASSSSSLLPTTVAFDGERVCVALGAADRPHGAVAPEVPLRHLGSLRNASDSASTPLHRLCDVFWCVAKAISALQQQTPCLHAQEWTGFGVGVRGDGAVGCVSLTTGGGRRCKVNSQE